MTPSPAVHTDAAGALIARILDAVPAVSFEMSALVALFRIEVTTDVPTACVTCGQRAVLRVNPDFVAEHCRTSEHLFLLVMHELHHVLLGHTRLFARPTLLHNLAFDAVINAQLCRRFPNHAYCSFFTRLYGDRDDAARLLAPPGGTPIADPELHALHVALYQSRDVTAQEVFESLLRLAPWVRPGVRLLGGHGERADEPGGSAVDPGAGEDELAEALGDIARRWPSHDGSGIGRSLDGALAHDRVAAASAGARVLAVLRRALLGAGTVPGGPRAPEPTTLEVPQALPTARDRRAQVLRAAGAEPLLYLRPVTVTRVSVARRASVYFDVSGSMDPFLPHLYGALRALRPYLAPQVHLFSTVVETVGLADIVNGVRVTTGGTEIACVLTHALAKGARKVLLLTDGYVGTPSPGLLRRVLAARLEFRVVLTPGGHRPWVEPFAARIEELPRLSS